MTADRYRPPCLPHTSGCRQCGKEIPKHRAYCSNICANVFEANHFWSTASYRAIEKSRPFGPTQKPHGYPRHGKPTCARCLKECGSFGGKREAEVNHIHPLNGQRPHFGCCHHQENLEVLCHACHVEIGIEQRAAGLIGRQRVVRAATPPRKRQQEALPLEMGA